MITRSTLAHIIVFVVLSPLAAIVVSHNDNNVVATYILEQQSHPWFHSVSQLEMPEDSILNIRSSSAFPVLFERNYPRPTNLCAGLNDTLVLQIQFLNESHESIGWHKSPETWIAPVLFNIRTNILSGAPSIDSTELKYEVRRWLWRGRTLTQAPPDTFPAKKYEYTLFLNVWGFPKGQWVLSSGLTGTAPKNVNLIESGMEFVYSSPGDGQDSVNAFIGCAERAKLEYNYPQVLYWTQMALQSYPKSVPAWWHLGCTYMEMGDSLLAVQAIDSALFYLDGFKDPLLPDTTERIAPIERQFIRYIVRRIPEDLYAFQNPY